MTSSLDESFTPFCEAWLLNKGFLSEQDKRGAWFFWNSMHPWERASVIASVNARTRAHEVIWCVPSRYLKDGEWQRPIKGTAKPFLVQKPRSAVCQKCGGAGLRFADGYVPSSELFTEEDERNQVKCECGGEIK